MEKNKICRTNVQHTNKLEHHHGNSSIKQWILLIIMTYTAFIFNTAEFIPIGLLSDIATDFAISEAQASLLISIYAWFVALLSLPLMMAVSRFDFKKILLGIIALFVLSHFLSAIASDFLLLLLSRLGVACAHAIFWSIISPLAIHIAPKGKSETALGMIITGTSLAMIAGLPLGRVIGLHLGWRFSFGTIGGAALFAFILLALLFPPVANKQHISIKTLPLLFKSPALRSLYIFTFLAVTAHYTGYSYIEPFLNQVAGLTNSLVTLSLTIFGIAGIGGSFLFSRYFSKHRILFFLSIPLGIILVLFSMQPAALNPYVSIALCVIWGLVFTLFNLAAEFEVIRYAPQYSTIAVALFSSVFNIGIGCGAVLGGITLDEWSISHIGYIGGSIAIIAFVFMLRKLLPALKYAPNRRTVISTECTDFN